MFVLSLHNKNFKFNIIMKRIWLICLLVIMVNVGMQGSEYEVYELSCEQSENPIGVDEMHPRFSWKIRSSERNTTQKAYQIMVSDSKEALERGDGNVWNSGRVESDESILIAYKGKPLQSFATYYWRVCSWNEKGEQSHWSSTATFGMGILSMKDWNGAAWIALEKDNPKNRYIRGNESTNDIPGYKEMKPYRMPQFRKEVKLKKTVCKAMAYISGLGQFEFFINGKKVGNHYFDPGWTHYDSLALYVPFDVTKMLVDGNNTLGVMLGGGFYSENPVDPTKRYVKIFCNYGAPKMKLDLHVEYTDGSKADFVSDKSWKVCESPVTFASVYGGEDYDATRYQEGWKTSGFNDKGWQKVVVTDYNVAMASQKGGITVREELPPVTVFKTRVGWMYDLGQNASGIFRIKVKGARGSKIVLKPCEVLPDDSICRQTGTYQGGMQYYTYTCRGDSEEVWYPQFSYYGFRYIQVEGALPAGKSGNSNLPVVLDLKGLHTCSDVVEAGTFNCSKQLFNKIHTLVDWAMRSNIQSVITDCPQREKLGWQEQDHLVQNALQYRYNMANIYTKIVRDMQQAQDSLGFIPDICPEYARFKGGFCDSPEWGGTFIISPYYYYQYYGDNSLMVRYYPYMKKYMDYLGTKAQGNILSYGLGDWLDLGQSTDGRQLTSMGVTATSTYFLEATIMQKTATMMGLTDDAAHYETLAQNIRKAFNDKFFHADSCYYDRNSQTANALALYLGMVDDAHKQGVLNNLIKDIRKHGNGVTAGDIGFNYLVKTLMDNNRSDVLFDMNSRYDVPGFGYNIAQGATSLTETWNPQKGDFSASNNHLMFGHILGWMYGSIGGIRQQDGSCGFKKILIYPQPVGDVTHARTTYDSPYGEIVCDWKLTDGAFSLRVNIPVNTEAVVCLPAKSTDVVTNYGQPVSADEAIKSEGSENGIIKLHIGSGDYFFSVAK
jgi:alpha-L-rhamnosidase